MKTHSTRRRGGFTLIELLVAMAITTIIVTVLVSITGIATDTWTRARSETRASRQAKTFIDTLAKDFESLVSRSGNDFEWLVAKEGSVSGAGSIRIARSSGSSPAAPELTFFTAATDRYLGEIGGASDQGGDVSCVGYRLVYQDPIGEGGSSDNTETFVVYRNLVDPDETFQSLLATDDLESAYQSFESESDELENFVCENVFQFSVTFLVEVIPDAENDPIPRIARVPLGVDGDSGEFRLRGTGIDTDINISDYTQEMIEGGRLIGIEMSASVVSDAGLARIADTGTGLNEKDYARQTYHYSRVVEVPSL